MEKSWITDRKPEKAGNYWVTLEYPIGRWNSKTEKFEQRENEYGREVAIRYYSEPTKYDVWNMTGENSNELHWTEETGSSYGERVVAWMPMDKINVCMDNAKENVQYVQKYNWE